MFFLRFAAPLHTSEQLVSGSLLGAPATSDAFAKAASLRMHYGQKQIHITTTLFTSSARDRPGYIFPLRLDGPPSPASAAERLFRTRRATWRTAHSAKRRTWSSSRSLACVPWFHRTVFCIDRLVKAARTFSSLKKRFNLVWNHGF